MKKQIFTSLFTLLCVLAFGQVIPEVPSTVKFADVTVKLDSDTRQKVSNDVRQLLTPQNSFFYQKVERMRVYFPVIERILEEENVPTDIKYLAVLESSLNPDAVSATNAVGFWQFKDFTANEMGLLVNNTQDDRKNLHLSTRAAARYLKKNNQIFRNWISSTLSFTLGVGGADSLVPIDWSFANEINLEQGAHPYLIKAIAHKIAFEDLLNQQDSNLSTVLLEYPATGKTLTQLSQETGISANNLKEMNSWIKAERIPNDKEYVAIVLTDKAYAESLKTQDKTQQIESIGYPRLKRLTLIVTSTDQPVLYEINDKNGILADKGDNAGQLAKKGKVSLKKFLSMNDMTEWDAVQEGRVYYLQKKYKKGPIPHHTLIQNQTLWEVSQDYGMRLKNLLKYNRIDKAEEILPGRVLWLQKKRPKKMAIKYNTDLTPPTEKFDLDPIIKDYEVAEKIEVSSNNEINEHRVRENETLSSIARQYGVSIDDLREANHLDPNQGININQILIIPSKSEPVDNWLEEDDEPIVMPRREVSETTETRPVNTVPKRDNTGVTTHYVNPGETLFGISKQYNITVQELRNLNNMSEQDVLKSGTWIRVSGAAQAGQTSNQATYSTGTHTVKTGETLFSISQTYNTTVEELKRLNQLTDNTIYVGQTLNIPGTTGSIRQTNYSNPEYYTVKAGDTLYSLSKRFGVSVEDLKYWNNMTSNNLIKGKRIIVKK